MCTLDQVLVLPAGIPVARECGDDLIERPIQAEVAVDGVPAAGREIPICDLLWQPRGIRKDLLDPTQPALILLGIPKRSIVAQRGLNLLPCLVEPSRILIYPGNEIVPRDAILDLSNVN
jgi:hypothetical protein